MYGWVTSLVLTICILAIMCFLIWAFYPKIQKAVDGFQSPTQYTSWMHADYQLIDDISGSALYSMWTKNMSDWLDFMYHNQRYKMCWKESPCSLGGGGCYTQNYKTYTPAFMGSSCDGGFVDTYHTGTAPGGKAWMDFDFNKWQSLSSYPLSGNLLSEDSSNKIYTTNPGYNSMWSNIRQFITNAGQLDSLAYFGNGTAAHPGIKPDAVSSFNKTILSNLQCKVKYDLGNQYSSWLALSGSLNATPTTSYTLPDTLSTGKSITKSNWYLTIPIIGYCSWIHIKECAVSMKYCFFDFSNAQAMYSYIRVKNTTLVAKCSPGLYLMEYSTDSNGNTYYNTTTGAANDLTDQLLNNPMDAINTLSSSLRAVLDQQLAIPSYTVTPTFLSFLPYYTRKYITSYINQTKSAIVADLSGSYPQLKSISLNPILPTPTAFSVSNVAFLNGLAQAYYKLYNAQRQITQIYDACTIGTSIVDVRCDIQSFGDPVPIQASLDAASAQYIKDRYDSTKHQSEVGSIIDNYRILSNQLQYNQSQNFLQPQALLDQQWNTQYGTQVASFTQQMRTMMADANANPSLINATYYSTLTSLEKQIATMNSKKVTLDPTLGPYTYSQSGVYLRFFVDPATGTPTGFSEGLNAALSFNTLYNSYIQVPTGNFPGTVNYIPKTVYDLNPKATLDCTAATGLKYIMADYTDYATMGLSGEVIKAGWNLTNTLVVDSVLGSKQLNPLECIVVWKESTFDSSNRRASGPSVKGGFFRYIQNTDQWYAKENIIDASGFHMSATPVQNGTIYNLTFSSAPSWNTSTTYTTSVAGKTIPITAFATPIVFPKILVDDTTLDTASGICPTVSCVDIVDKIVDQFNNDTSVPGMILDVVKVTTPNPMQCDIEAHINYDTVKEPSDGSEPATAPVDKVGIILETRAFLVSVDPGTCKYTVNDYGVGDDNNGNTGYSIESGTPALPTPFNYAKYASDVLTTNTAAIFQPLTNTLSTAFTAVTNAVSPFRKNTYTTLGKMNTFASCPQVKCTDPAVMYEFIKAYENANWTTSRINSILGAGQFDSLTVDFIYDANPLTIDASGNVAKGALSTYGARCKMVNTGYCYFAVASFIPIVPFPTYADLKVLSVKPCAASLYATPYINERPIIYIDCKSKLASSLIKQRGAYWFSNETMNRFPNVLLDAKNIDLQTCSFNLVLSQPLSAVSSCGPSHIVNGTRYFDCFFDSAARKYISSPGTVLRVKRTYRFTKNTNNQFILDEPLSPGEANYWSTAQSAQITDTNGKPYIQKVSEEDIKWDSNSKQGTFITGKPANYDWTTYTPKPIRVNMANVQLDYDTTCPQVNCGSSLVQATSGFSVKDWAQVNYNTCEFRISDVSGMAFGDTVKNVTYYTDDYPAKCSAGVASVSNGVETASKWKYTPNPSDPALAAMVRVRFATQYGPKFTIIKLVSTGLQSDLSVIYEAILQEFDSSGSLVQFWAGAAASADIENPAPTRFIYVHFRKDFDSSKPVYIYYMALLDPTYTPSNPAGGSLVYKTPFTAQAPPGTSAVNFRESVFVNSLLSQTMIYIGAQLQGPFGQFITSFNNNNPVPVEYSSTASYPRAAITDTTPVPNPAATMTAFTYLKLTFTGSLDVKDSLVELLRYNFYNAGKLLLFPNGSYSLLSNGTKGKTPCSFTMTNGACSVPSPAAFYDDPTTLASTVDLTKLPQLSIPIGYSIIIKNPVPVTVTSFSFTTGYNAYRNPTRWHIEGSLNGTFWKKLSNQSTDFIYPAATPCPSYYLSPYFDLTGAPPVPRTPLPNVPKTMVDCGIVPTDWTYIKSIYDAGLQKGIQLQVPTTDYDIVNNPPGDSVTISIYVTGIASYIISPLENAVYYTVKYGMVVVGTKTSIVRVNPPYINISSAPDTIKNLFANNFQSIVKISFAKAQTCAQVIPMSQVISYSLTMPIVPPTTTAFTAPTNVPTGTIFPFGWGGFTGLESMRNIGQYILVNAQNSPVNLEAYQYFTNKINQSGIKDQVALTVSLNTTKYLGLMDMTSPYFGRQSSSVANDYNYVPYTDETPGYASLVTIPVVGQTLIPYYKTTTNGGYRWPQNPTQQQIDLNPGVIWNPPCNFYIRKDLVLARSVRVKPTKMRSTTATNCSIGSITFYIEGTPIPIQTATATYGTNANTGVVVDDVYSGTAKTIIIDTTASDWQITGKSFTVAFTADLTITINFTGQRIFDSYSITTSTDVAGNDPLRWTMEYSVDGFTWSNFQTLTIDAPLAQTRSTSIKTGVTTIEPNFSQITLGGTINGCSLLPTDWPIIGPFFTLFGTKQGVNIVGISQFGYNPITNMVYYIVQTDSTDDMYVKIVLNTANCSAILIVTLYQQSMAFPEQPTMFPFTGITNMPTGSILPKFWGGFTLSKCGLNLNDWSRANQLITAFNKTNQTIGTLTYNQFIIKITDVAYNDDKNSIIYKFTSGLLLVGGTIVNPPSLNTGALADYYTSKFTQYATLAYQPNNCKTPQTLLSITYSWSSPLSTATFSPFLRILDFNGWITNGNKLFQNPVSAPIPLGSVIVGGTTVPGTTISAVRDPQAQSYTLTGSQPDVGGVFNMTSFTAFVPLPATLPYGYGGFTPSFCGITAADDIRVLNALFTAYTKTGISYNMPWGGGTQAVSYSLLINNIIQHAYNATTTTAYYKIKVVVIMDIAAQAAWIKSQLTNLANIYGGVTNPNYILQAPAYINSQITVPINPTQLSGINYYTNNFTSYVKIKLGISDCQTIPVSAIQESFTAFADAPALATFTPPTTFIPPKGYGLFTLVDYGTSPIDWSIISPMIVPLTQSASLSINGVTYNFTIVPSSIKQYAFDPVLNAVYYQVKLYARATGTPPAGNRPINPTAFSTITTTTPTLTPSLKSYYDNNFLLTVRLTYNKTTGTAPCTFNKIETSWTPFTGQPAWNAFPGVVNPPTTYPDGWGGILERTVATAKYVKYYPLDVTTRLINGQSVGNLYMNLNFYFNGNRVAIPSGTQVTIQTNDTDAGSPWKIGSNYYPIDANGHINWSVYNNPIPPYYDGMNAAGTAYLPNHNPSALLSGNATSYVLTDLDNLYRGDSQLIYFLIVFPSSISFDSVTFTIPSTPALSSAVQLAKGWNIMTSPNGITYTTFHKFTMLPKVGSTPYFEWPSPLQGSETSILSASQLLVESFTSNQPSEPSGPMSSSAIQATRHFMASFRNPFKPISHTYNPQTRECQYLQDDSSLVSIYFNSDGTIDRKNSNPQPFKISRMNGVPDIFLQGPAAIQQEKEQEKEKEKGFKSLYNRSFADDFEQPLMTPSRAGESRAFPQGGVAPIAQNYMLTTTTGSVYKYIRIRFLKTRVEDAPYVQIGGLQLYGEKDQLLTGKISNLMGSPVDATTDVRALAKGGTWTDTNKSPLTVSFEEPTGIVAFGFTTATVAKSTAFDPVRWKVEGSMNGILWTPLLSQEYMTPMARGVTTPPFRF